jgi:ATP-dependent helicase/nuclease subunit A
VAELFLVPTAEATPNDARPPDWLAREQALDVRQSWIVEAPAGSGKTGLLIQRYLKLLADESVEQPEQVLAITYTVKATAEIRDRVVAQLRSAANTVDSTSDFERETRKLAQNVLRRDELLGWRLLEHPRRLNLRTIDSVCGEIARSLPVLSGGGGRQSPVADATLLYREAARRTLMQLGGTDSALNESLRTVLLHRDGNLGNLEQLLAEMLSLRDQWGELIPLSDIELDDAYLDGNVLPQLQRALEQAICAGLTQLAHAFPPAFLEELATLAAEMAHAEGYNGEPSPLAVCAQLRGAPEESAQHLGPWRALIHLLTTKDRKWRTGTARNHLRFEIEADHAVRLKHLIDQVRHRDDLLTAIQQVKHLPPAEYPQSQWLVAKALFRVLRRALVELQLVFAQRGECDFTELGLLARTALLHSGAVDDLAAALGMKLQHLLVDEMQDTSTSQYQLIELLTHGWDGHSQTVFLVGDPKQSIYLFRQARVERFVRTMLSENLGDLPVGCLRLTANFRSQASLVRQFNEDFSLLFPREANPANPEEVPFVEAVAVRAAANGTRSVMWHAGVLPPGLPTHDLRAARRRQANRNAQEVRAIIEQWRARPLPQGRSEPWKIAVLVRGRNLLAEIVAALKGDGEQGAIPFRAVDIEALDERREVLDLFALTRALLHPADRAAWLAILHAPWCGLGLAELHLLAGADEAEWAERSMMDVITLRGELLSEESCQRLARVWTILNAAQQQRSRLTVAQLVERTWRSLGGDATLGPAEMTNARRYLHLIDEMEQQNRRMDLGLLKRRLHDLYSQPDTSASAVDLMTIHRSKGLEWDVVIVPGLEKRVPQSRGRLLAWDEIDSDDDAAARVVLAPIKSKGKGSEALNLWLNGIHSAREAAEQKRLFYVASTRAREELHLFAIAETAASGTIRPPVGSLLRTAWPVANRHFVASPQESTMAQSAHPASSAENEFVGDMAAEGSERSDPPILERLPLTFDPQKRWESTHRISYGDEDIPLESAHFARPQGSFEARAFGNAVHAFLELASQRLAGGATVDALLREIPNWTPRITAILRAEGLPQSQWEKRTPQVKTALTHGLQDAEGIWILAAHDEAASEYALTSWAEGQRSIRIDRVFRAGPKPLADGNDSTWIVDYKTATHGREGIEAFLEEERAKYSAQMETYARILKSRAPARPIRVGLYYPMLPKFIWWTPESA